MKIAIAATMNKEETKINVRFDFVADDIKYSSPDEQYKDFKNIYKKAFSLGFVENAKQYELIAEIDPTEEAAKPLQAYAEEIGTTILLY